MTSKKYKIAEDCFREELEFGEESSIDIECIESGILYRVYCVGLKNKTSDLRVIQLLPETKRKKYIYGKIKEELVNIYQKEEFSQCVDNHWGSV